MVESKQDEYKPTGEPVVVTRELRKVFKPLFSNRSVTAVESLDLSIKRGEIFGLLGPNGSGKTTTIKLLLGLIFPTSGEISVFDRPAGNNSAKERIGFLPEESYLYRFLNADETLAFYGSLFNMPRATVRERSDELIKAVGLGGARKRVLAEYSKGMARRIGLAQALINDPELVILDEPTSGMDPIGTREVKDLILKLKDEGKTVLLSSHLLADVEDVCDRIAILNGGRLERSGRVDELLRKKDILEIAVRDISDESREAVEKLLDERGEKVLYVRQARTTLEEYFVSLIKGRDKGL